MCFVQLYIYVSIIVFLNEKQLGVLIQRKLTVCFRVLRSSLMDRTIVTKGVGTGRGDRWNVGEVSHNDLPHRPTHSK